MGYSWNMRNRCPNCDGYAGAFKDAKRCRGFAHKDGEGFFCEQEERGFYCEQPERIEDSLSTSAKSNALSAAYNFSGYDLYYHRYEQEET